MDAVERKLAKPNRILLTVPNGFRVESAINPHMQDAAGKLNVVDGVRALAQWNELRALYSHLGIKTELIEGAPEYPDMVFCANQTFPFINAAGRPSVILSRMWSDTRRGEVPAFHAWATERNLAVYHLSDVFFEGSGDAIWNLGSAEVLCGHGFRTEERAIEQLREVLPFPVVALRLVDKRFYHLDTCLVILDEDTAAYVPEAFDAEARKTIEERFPNLIRIHLDEALNSFAGNAFCPDGENVILQKGARYFAQNLRQLGFRVHEVDTSEFIKAGGSVFCMKQYLWL
jgi:N-dimethylarginine dimethylaminohydrolase